MGEAGHETSCRLDLWLWRARFAKTRSQAARLVESGRVQRWRGALRERMDKPARSVRIGDGLVFAIGGRLTAVRVASLGKRRGPAAEARALYAALQEPPALLHRKTGGAALAGTWEDDAIACEP